MVKCWSSHSQTQYAENKAGTTVILNGYLNSKLSPLNAMEGGQHVDVGSKSFRITGRGNYNRDVGRGVILYYMTKGNICSSNLIIWAFLRWKSFLFKLVVEMEGRDSESMRRIWGATAGLWIGRATWQPLEVQSGPCWQPERKWWPVHPTNTKN